MPLSLNDNIPPSFGELLFPYLKYVILVWLLITPSTLAMEMARSPGLVNALGHSGWSQRWICGTGRVNHSPSWGFMCIHTKER